MKTMKLIMFAAALHSLAAITNARDNEMKTEIVPTADGQGVAACVSIGFDDLRELPSKAVQGFWSLIVCVTQPIHPYHYVRDDQEKIVTDSDGDNKKVWLPFYRLWGEHQGDSVVGIVYDNRGTNGIAGGHWFAGYGNSGWKDKGGKLAGLALLAWGASEAFDSDHGRNQDRGSEEQQEPVVTVNHDDDSVTEQISVPEMTTPTPEPEPDPPIPPAWPAEWEGEGGPVGM